jgi:hypothetical protein
VVAALILGAFLFWVVLSDITPGRSGNGSVSFLLWSGWIALTFYVVLVLYAVRKYAHKARLTPEFRMKLPIAQLEKAQSKLSDIKVRVLAGQLRNRARIKREVKRIFKEEGVSRVLRVKVTTGRPGGPAFHVHVLPREPIARVAKWMHAHLYYGLAAAGLVWLHGGGTFDTPMGLLLNGLSYLVILTGCLGIVIWTFGPAYLTRHERDLSLEKAFNLRDHYARKVQEAEKAFVADDEKGVFSGLARKLRALERSGAQFGVRAKSLLDDLRDAMPEQFQEDPSRVRDLLVLVGQRRNVEREWRTLARIRFYMNIWRAVHVPASILLMVFVVVHILSVWWY